ncbi:uncharacterized protein LOC133127396 [Conger conger]|uniref:uncharacterized protein LOC133127396 n=1 Tax=Conger conger TaxID=82655 RepID=UPI002A599D45|nr:uncharacterized protein LOC133127396 [Conger conger]
MMMMMVMITPALTFSGFAVEPTSLPSSVLFESGAPVMLEGDPVQMSCPSLQSNYSLIYRWSFRNWSSGLDSTIGSNQTLPVKTAMPEDSGHYNCTVSEIGIVPWSSVFSTDLTVVERLSASLVVVGFQGLVVIEGSGLVTLKCVTSSGPSPVSWSWYRLAGVGLRLVEVGQEQELSLGRTADSGEYLCRAETSTLGLTQIDHSDSHQVDIIPLPVGLPVGIAALVLVFLCLLLLVLVAAWLFIQRERETAALHKQANGSPAKGHPGPGMELKEDSKTVEDEVYMNCETSGEGYTDLNHDEISEDNTYDCLS